MPYKDKSKQSAFQSAANKKRRESWLAENGPCKKCGSSDNLEVDHINPAEKASHRIWSWSKARRDAELAKCQVLCSECHKEKTKDYLASRVMHGSETAYKSYGCRCLVCGEAMRQRRKRSRDRFRKNRFSCRKLSNIPVILPSDLHSEPIIERVSA